MFDPMTGALVDRREAQRMSWFSAAGQFDTNRTGVQRVQCRSVPVPSVMQERPRPRSPVPSGEA